MPDKKNLILVVDDEPANLKVLLSFLKNHGFHIHIAKSGKRALLALEKEQPDLILLDVMMPGLDGYETCKQIKKNKDTAPIPIIFMTALDNIEDKVAAFDAGGVDYISKPFQKGEVLARVNTHISLYKQKQTLEYLIQERTAALNKSNQKLEQKNIALKVLLEQQQADGEEIKETLSTGIKHLIYPYLDLLHTDMGSAKLEEYISILYENLDTLAAPLTSKLTNPLLGLTPKEILVANLVKERKSTKEIAHLLNLSPTTTERYRNNIRNKIGIRKKKIRLSDYLNSFPHKD